ncbi:MAG: hypothetical protein BWY50_02078 [Spirochaetes bacterium ADurb.Bin315]|nr:MAG: hypothetical protein BWY50_02078 [Spirochaetes bacterium ADurb.Bin315]
MNTNSQALTIPGSAKGKMMVLKTLPREAPQSMAASSRDGSMACNTPMSAKNAVGAYAMVSTTVSPVKP